MNKRQTYITNRILRARYSIQAIGTAARDKLVIWRLRGDTHEPKVTPEVAHWLVTCPCELPEARFPDMRTRLGELEGRADEMWEAG